MNLTSGDPKVKIALVDGPVFAEHNDLQASSIKEVGGSQVRCRRLGSEACVHGTFIAGILSGRRGSSCPAICPSCTLLVRQIFSETSYGPMPSATPQELANAIIECVNEGANVINLSVGLSQTSSNGLHYLKNTLDYAANKGVIVVAASGNQSVIGGTVLTNHPGVISVVACDELGRPMDQSNLGCSISRWGLMAPGKRIKSLVPEGGYSTMSGTSVAAPFVSGAIGLLWSLFPRASVNLLRLAITQSNLRRKTIVPPLFDACKAYQSVSTNSKSM